jgi:hypothetical protein
MKEGLAGDWDRAGSHMMMILANHAKHSKKKLSMLMCVCQHMFETSMKLCHNK